VPISLASEIRDGLLLLQHGFSALDHRYGSRHGGVTGDDRSTHPRIGSR
jgi:hypothetical protein